MTATSGPILKTITQLTNLTAFGEAQVAQLTPLAGWKFAYNINPDMVKTTVAGGGAVTESNGRALLSTGAAAGGKAKIETIPPLRYIPGCGGLARFTAVFTPGVAGSKQLIGIGNEEEDGLFVGYNGVDFGLCRVVAGVEHWVYADGMNGDGRAIMKYFNPAAGNIFQLQYQWLGYGGIRWFMERPESAEFELLHLLQYANSSAETTLRNPTLPLMALVENTTNDTAVTMLTPSAIAGIEGDLGAVAPIHPFSLYRTLSATKTGITTEANVLTLSNPATYFGRTNRTRIRLTRVSFYGEGSANSPVFLRGVVGATLGGTPNYVAYDLTRSPISRDTAGTTVTGGTERMDVKLGRNVGVQLDLEPLGIELAPGQTFTLSVSSAQTIAADLAVTWIDQF
jgi:hypothetical protein